jgi:hypothetical protein
VKIPAFRCVTLCILVEGCQFSLLICRLHIYATLDMEEDGFSKNTVKFYDTARRHIPEDSNPHSHSRENLKSHMDSSGSGQGPVARSHEHGNEPSHSAMSSGFRDELI